MNLLFVDGHDEDRVVRVEELLGQHQAAPHERQPFRVTVGVVAVNKVVVVLPVLGSGVVRRVDVDAVDLPGVSELEHLQRVMVLGVDDDLGGLVAATLDRADPFQTWVDRFAELGDDCEIIDRHRGRPAIGGNDGRLPPRHPPHIERMAVGAVTSDGSHTATDWMLR